MRYTNKAGVTIVYKRDYKKEKERATGFINISTVPWVDKQRILRHYLATNSMRNTVQVIRAQSPHLSGWKITAIIKHYLAHEDEYYQERDGFWIRLF